jgi:uncharacterized membrane protein
MEGKWTTRSSGKGAKVVALSKLDEGEAAQAPGGSAVNLLVDEWVTADLITAEQAAAISTYHSEHHLDDARSRGFRRMVSVLSIFGAVLVGAGLLLVVASNWQTFTPTTKTAIAIATFVTIEAVGYGIRFRTGYHHTGEAVLFVGAVAYGAAIFLVAQTYNRPLDDDSLFMFWLLPVFPLAYVVRSRLVSALSLAVTFGVIGYKFTDWAAGTSSMVLAVATTYLLIGAAVVSLGGVQRDVPTLRYLAPPWEWIGAATILTVLFVMSFSSVYDWTEGWIQQISGSLQTILVVAGVLTASGIVMRTVLRKRFDKYVAVTASITGLAMIAAAFLITAPFNYHLVAFTVMNLLLLLALVVLVVGGVAIGRQSLVNIALVVFAVSVFARYIEIGAGMLGTGTAMIFGGVLLIGLGVGLERFRRSLVARMPEDGVVP